MWKRYLDAKSLFDEYQQHIDNIYVSFTGHFGRAIKEQLPKKSVADFWVCHVIVHETP